MTHPTAEDYLRAVQDPARAFRRPDLQQARFAVHPVFGIPMPASGNAAVVFRAEVAGRDRALRFFIRDDVASAARYAALGGHVARHALSGDVAAAEWIDDAIAVRGSTWPMLQMEWVDGRTLDAYVGQLAEQGDVAGLHALAWTWRELVGRMQDGGFAHGDLQHGNVLVDGRRRFRLVDMDGAWVEGFADRPPPGESGHPHYQRTGRVWGRWMDTFPALVIYTSLLALSRRPELWQRLHTGENLLFESADYTPPLRRPAWDALAGIADPAVQDAAARLRQACLDPRPPESGLETLLRAPVLLTVQPVAPVPPGPLPPGPWWVLAARGEPTPFTPPVEPARAAAPAAASGGWTRADAGRHEGPAPVTRAPGPTPGPAPSPRAAVVPAGRRSRAGRGVLVGVLVAVALLVLLILAGQG